MEIIRIPLMEFRVSLKFLYVFMYGYFFFWAVNSTYLQLFQLLNVKMLKTMRGP